MSIRIGPVRFSSRGARVSIGPRIARIHVGGGRTGFSSGIGPVTVSSSGRRRRRRPQQPVYRGAPGAQPKGNDPTVLFIVAGIAALTAVSEFASMFDPTSTFGLGDYLMMCIALAVSGWCGWAGWCRVKRR